MVYQAVSFDFDGVLADTEPLNMAAEQQVCRNHGFDVPVEFWQELRGLTNRETFRRLLLRAGLEPHPHLIAALVKEKRAIVFELAKTDARAIPGALNGVRFARSLFKKVGLTTSNNRPTFELICKSLGFEGWFDVIVTGEDVRVHKPDPEPYLVTANRLGIAPESMCVVEDSLNGIMAAQAAGCCVIGLATTFPADSLTASGVHATAADFDEVIKLLHSLAGVG